MDALTNSVWNSCAVNVPVTVKLPVNVSVVLSKYEPVAPLSAVMLVSLVSTLPAIDPEKLVIEPDISEAI